MKSQFGGSNDYDFSEIDGTIYIRSNAQLNAILRMFGYGYSNQTLYFRHLQTNEICDVTLMEKNGEIYYPVVDVQKMAYFLVNFSAPEDYDITCDPLMRKYYPYYSCYDAENNKLVLVNYLAHFERGIYTGSSPENRYVIE